MEFETLLNIVGDEPVFETGLLLAGDVNPDNVRRQLTRWTQAGKIYQLRRGIYALAPPYQKVAPHPFVVANALVRGAYVSLQSALSYAGLIPEYTPVTTSVTTERTGEWRTPLGAYTFRHIKTSWFYGYRHSNVAQRQTAFVASPEKALLDLIYLEPRADSPDYLDALRLQHLDILDLERLCALAEQSGRPKLERATQHILTLAQQEMSEYEIL
jgi:hypothetical protein